MLDRAGGLHAREWLSRKSPPPAVCPSTVELTIQSFLPGSHKQAKVHSRFVRAAGGGTEFEPVPGVEKGEEDWDKMDGWKEAPVKAGTMVLIHGKLAVGLEGSS